jgi:hypothetical protein
MEDNERVAVDNISTAITEYLSDTDPSKSAPLDVVDHLEVLVRAFVKAGDAEGLLTWIRPGLLSYAKVVATKPGRITRKRKREEHKGKHLEIEGLGEGGGPLELGNAEILDNDIRWMRVNLDGFVLYFGEMTIAQHTRKVNQLQKHIRTQVQTSSLHSTAVETLKALGANNLFDPKVDATVVVRLNATSVTD